MRSLGAARGRQTNFWIDSKKTVLRFRAEMVGSRSGGVMLRNLIENKK